jgi:hypothetical protein
MVCRQIKAYDERARQHTRIRYEAPRERLGVAANRSDARPRVALKLDVSRDATARNDRRTVDTREKRDDRVVGISAVIRFRASFDSKSCWSTFIVIQRTVALGYEVMCVLLFQARPS